MGKNIVIVGAGITAAYIVKKLKYHTGSNITVVDAKSVAAGASQNMFSSFRIIHKCPKISELAFYSIPTFSSISDEIKDVAEFDPRGALYFFRLNEIDHFQKLVTKYNHENWPIELIDASEGRRRFPMFHWNNDTMATYEPHACAFNVRKLTQALFKEEEDNITILENTPVTGFVTTGHSVKGIRTSEDTILADHVILATGAWTNTILQDLGISTGLRNKQIQVQITSPLQYAKSLPIYFDSHSTGFGKGSPDGQHIFGYALQDWGDKPKYQLEDNRTQSKMALDINMRLIPSLESQEGYASFRLQDGYHSGFKSDFIVPLRWKGLTIAAGWGGTGFKVAPAIGQRVANHVIQVQQGF